MAPEEQYRFGPFQLDATERELHRDGEVVPLTAKTFDLLLMLVQGAGRTFTKSELLESLWPAAVVDESNLSQTVFLLRKALGENGDDTAYILTVPRRGYKFIGKVSQKIPEPARARRQWLRPAVGMLAIVALAALAYLRFREVRPDARAVRSAIVAPENTFFIAACMALSPDGRRIVFTAGAKNGKGQLWIRPLDVDTAQPLEGTEGAQQPFWSPDSRWVGFFADGKLKKIDTQGGPPITLADAPVPLGGSWSRNGVILFSPTWDALQQIPAAGGTATPAAAAARVGNLQCCPWFLPDGEHYLFSAQTRGGGDVRVNLLVGSLDSTVSQLVANAANAMYAQGRLLYLRGTTLMAQTFDLKALRTTGEALPIAESVGHYEGPFQFGFFSVSSTGLLAYQTLGRTGRQQLTWFDRSGKALDTIGVPGTFYDIEFAPDRKRLAASAVDAAGNADIWIYDLAPPGLRTHFTFDPAAEFRAVWAPDGSRIVFNSKRKRQADLYRKSANGAGAEDLFYADTREKYPVSWSRDGKFLLYHDGGGPKSADLWVLPLASKQSGVGPQAQPFLKAGSFGQFSPDDRWVAYESHESQGAEIYVVPFSRPTEKHQISPGGGLRPRWRQDGKEIFYLTPNRQLMAAEVRISGDTVEVGAIRVLIGGAWIFFGAGYLYDVSADGQRILAVVPTNPEGPPPITLLQNWTALLKK